MRRFVPLFLAILMCAGFVQAQRITVTRPAADDAWSVGSTHDILWTTQGTMDDEVKILLFQGGARVLEITARVPNNGRFTWTIPGTVTPGRYSVRVRTIDGAAVDNSDEFAITVAAQSQGASSTPGPLTLVTPNGKEQLAIGRPYKITWRAASGAPGGTRLDLFLLHEGRPVGLIAPEIPVSQRFFEWTVGSLQPGVAPPGSEYKVRIRAHGTTIEDESDKTFMLVRESPSSCDFGVEDVTLANGRSLEQGIVADWPSNSHDISDVFIVKVRWNRTNPAVSGGQHFIRARAVLTDAWLDSAPSTPPRFSEANADASGIITIRFPFRFAWAEIPRVTRDSRIPIEFGIAFSRGDFDSVAENNTRTFDLQVVGVQPLPDFVAEIIPGTVWGEAVNALDSRDRNILDFRARVRFKNLARNAVGGPAAPFPGVNYLAHVFYMDNEGRWQEAYWDWEESITVPSDDWVVVDIQKIHSNHFTGESTIPVNQWKPLKFEITINDEHGHVIPEVSRGNNRAVVEFEVK
jgi:hypothetical protein